MIVEGISVLKELPEIFWIMGFIGLDSFMTLTLFVKVVRDVK